LAAYGLPPPPPCCLLTRPPAAGARTLGVLGAPFPPQLADFGLAKLLKDSHAVINISGAGAHRSQSSQGAAQ
jgi:hypothetical protein